VSNHLQPEKMEKVDERLQTPQMIGVAADLTRYMLDSNPDRRAHSQATARRAELLTVAVDPECALPSVAAAWLPQHKADLPPSIPEMVAATGEAVERVLAARPGSISLAGGDTLATWFSEPENSRS
jgi:hypothetical protein